MSKYNNAFRSLESTFVERRNIVIACEDMDFTWDESDVHRVIELWNRGVSISDIARAVDRDDGDELMILLIDLARNQRIKKRTNGVWGN